MVRRISTAFLPRMLALSRTDGSSLTRMRRSTRTRGECGWLSLMTPFSNAASARLSSGVRSSVMASVLGDPFARPAIPVIGLISAAIPGWTAPSRRLYKRLVTASCSASRRRHSAGDALGRVGERRARGRSAGSSAPNLLANYLYLWESTLVLQAAETARISV